MKKIFFLSLLAFSLTFISCSKTAETPLDSSYVLSGTIADYVTNTLDSIKVTGSNNMDIITPDALVGKCKVSSSGGFSFTLSTPTVLTKNGGEKGLTVSDTTAMVSNACQFYCYKNGIVTGYLVKCNNKTDSITKGLSISAYTYSDRTFTSKGTTTSMQKYSNSSYSRTAIFDLTITKGWNEFTYTVNAFSIGAGYNYMESGSYTSSIVPNLQWRFIAYPSYNARSNERNGQKVQKFLH